MTHIPFKMTLKWAEMIAPSVRHLAFEKIGEPLQYKAGQFISIHFDHDGQKLKRSYSVATAPNHQNLIEIAVSYVKEGPASKLLFELQPGDSLETTGPYGRFILQETHPPRYVLMGTGTGVTPYLAMLPDLKQCIEKEHLEIVLVVGVKSREHLLYGQRFVEFSEALPHFKFLACYSREFPHDPNPFERQGHVQDSLSEIKPDPDRDIVYLCGNPSMIDDTFSRLKEGGFSVHQIRREKYISGT